VTSSRDLKAAIAALEAQRSELGDNIVDIAIEPLQARLDELRSKDQATNNTQRMKQVTVLFADIVGSTVLARQFDPEDVHGIIDSSLASFTTIIEYHHGRVLQYAGDSLLAAFGTDESHEEDPENAVRAGLAILEALQGIASDFEERHDLKEFNIRVGVNTGRVLLGGGVDAENSIRGLTVHVAARMEQNAPAGGIRISHDTYRQVRGVFDVSEQLPIDVKGLAEPMRSYLVHGIKPRAFRSRLRGIDGIETRMIGREAELLQLQQSLHALYDKNSAHYSTVRVITVVADAGIGKSRLLYEFENWAEARPESYYIFKGCAQPQTRQQSYGLLRSIVAWRLQISESDSAEVARNNLLEKIAPLFGPDEAAEIDMLGHLVGLDFSASPHLRGVLEDSQQIRNRGFHAAAQIFRRLSQRDDLPCVLILDDLQWADDDSLDFLNYLFEVNHDVPMLVIGMARPELYERRPRWPASDSSAIRIDLQPLSGTDSHELASELLSRLNDIPVVLRELITNSADGNPFYMEELIKMLIDDGAIARDDEHWQMVPEKLLSARVPDTLTGILQARLDSLSVAERTTLQRASVIGFVFWDHALASLDADCVACLPQLVQRELIVPRTDSSFEGAHEYAFHHQILHQVTYESVLKHDRKYFHHGMAVWFENRIKERGDDYLGATANHYEHAGEVQRATQYYVRAAEYTASRHSCDATLQYVQKALTLADKDDHTLRWRLLIARETVLATQEDRVAHDADLDALQITADALGADNLKAEALLRRAMALCSAGRYSDAEEASRSVLQFAQDEGTSKIAAEAIATQAFSLRRMGDFPAAQIAAEAGLRLACKSGDRAAEGELLANLSGLAAESGDSFKCIQLDNEYLAITRETGDRTREINALNTIGDNAFRMGNYVMARKCLDEALSLSRNIGHRYGECVVLLNLANLTNLQNDNKAAINFAQDSIAISAQSGLRDLEAAAMLPLGLAQTELGEMDKAQMALGRSRDLFDENSSPHLAMEPVAGLAYLALMQSDVGTAIEYVDKVLRHLENDGSLDGTEEPLRIRWMLCNVLQHAEDTRAMPLLVETHRQLHERAGKISNTQMRRTFLENVPHNQAIETAWKRQAGSSGKHQTGTLDFQ